MRPRPVEIRIVFCLAAQPPQVLEVNTDEDHLERLVGGGTTVNLDCAKVQPGVDLWCIEDAIAKGCAPNRNVPGVGWVHGPFFLAASTEDGDMLSLEPARAAELVALVESWPILPGSYGKKN